jgi:hypothetical protein
MKLVPRQRTNTCNQNGKRVAHRKLECDLKQVTQFLKPLKPQLQSMAVESTFNWYWLVDRLRSADYPIDLANPAKIEQCNGLKHADDDPLLAGHQFLGFEALLQGQTRSGIAETQAAAISQLEQEQFNIASPNRRARAE